MDFFAVFVVGRAISREDGTGKAISSFSADGKWTPLSVAADTFWLAS